MWLTIQTFELCLDDEHISLYEFKANAIFSLNVINSDILNYKFLILVVQFCESSKLSWLTLVVIIFLHVSEKSMQKDDSNNILFMKWVISKFLYLI